ncbi:MAG: DUF6364 family protein [Desulfurococcales archaeon]|nr:DUF6364 family protein [Desulfurococcales archaeon]
MGKKKLTLSVNEDLLDEIRKIVAGEGRSISGIVEEYFEYLASTSWIESLSEELGIGKLEPTTEREIPETRPKGLDAGRIVRQVRKNREERITYAL